MLAGSLHRRLYYDKNEDIVVRNKKKEDIVEPNERLLTSLIAGSYFSISA